jgi:hypothetical protein
MSQVNLEIRLATSLVITVCSQQKLRQKVSVAMRISSFKSFKSIKAFSAISTQSFNQTKQTNLLKIQQTNHPPHHTLFQKLSPRHNRLHLQEFPL